MKYTLTLSEVDFLNFQLYVASKSPRIKKTRIRSWLLVSGVFFCLSFLFYNQNSIYPFFYFLIFGIISLLFYPFYNRWRYKRHYRSFISDNYQGKIGIIETVEITDEYISSVNKIGEGKINISEVTGINETGEYIFVKLSSESSLIFPKSQIEQLDQLKEQLKQLSERLQIPYNLDLDWKWS